LLNYPFEINFRTTVTVKSKTAAVQTDVTLDALVTLVQTLRTLHLATGGHQPWLCLDLTMVQFKSVLLLVFTGGMTSRGLADQLGVGSVRDHATGRPPGRSKAGNAGT